MVRVGAAGNRRFARRFTGGPDGGKTPTPPAPEPLRTLPPAGTGRTDGNRRTCLGSRPGAGQTGTGTDGVRTVVGRKPFRRALRTGEWVGTAGERWDSVGTTRLPLRNSVPARSCRSDRPLGTRLPSSPPTPRVDPRAVETSPLRKSGTADVDSARTGPGRPSPRESPAGLKTESLPVAVGVLLPSRRETGPKGTQPRSVSETVCPHLLDKGGPGEVSGVRGRPG